MQLTFGRCLQSAVITTMLPWTLTLLSVLVAVAPSHGTPLADKVKSATGESSEDYRLPKSVSPLSYFIGIFPNYNGTSLLNTKGFTGLVIITARIESQRFENDIIELHKGANIHIKWGVLYDRKSTSFFLRTKDYNETEKIGIIQKNNFNIGEKIAIVLAYEAEFTEDGSTGAYISSYNINGKTSALLTTNFKPTHARKVFPCFDEPQYMANFTLLIALKGNFDAISNTEGLILSNDNKIFKPSPKMSTHHLAFTIYEKENFRMIEESTQTGSLLPFRVWSNIPSQQREDLVHEDSKGLLIVEGPAALHFMEQYTGIAFKSKMDIVAIPGVQLGAMEDWGLITSGAPFNGQIDTSATYEKVVDALDNGLSHMWFGNLVTADWWSSIWLNEGFARYMQYLVAHHRYPNWHMLERFVLDEQMGAFGVDASVGAAPLTDKTVLTPTQIGDHFSTISYSKGAAILRQISNVMGEQNFREGIHQFLEKNSRQPVTPDELFEHLRSFHKSDITNLTDETEFVSVLKDWTTKPGYPLITVTRTGKTFSVSQERFLLNPDEESDPIFYPVYLTWRTSRDDISNASMAPQKWLEASDYSIEFNIEDIYYKDWVLFNVHQGGYYRVNYDEGTWKRIGSDLDAGRLELVAAIDRAALVDNAVALARARKLPYELALRLLRFLRHDPEFEPWAAARSALVHMQRMLGGEKPFQDFIAFIVEKAYNATGFDGRLDAHIEKVHRTNVLSLACGAGYERCLEEAKELLNAYMAVKEGDYNDTTVIGVKIEEEDDEAISPDIHTGPVHPDVESVVFCYGLKGASPETWEKLWDEYAESDTARRSVLITALGCIDHRETLKEFLLKSLDPQQVQDVQDAHRIFSSVYANLDGGAQIALDFLTFWGYKKLEQRYGSVRNSMSVLISGLAETLTTEAQKKQLEIVLRDSGSSHEIALKTVQSNIDWIKTQRISVLVALDNARTNSFSSGLRFLSTPILVIVFAALIFEVR